MTFKPLSSRDGWHGLWAVLGLLGLAAGLLAQVPGRPIDGLSFLLAMAGIALFALAGYLAYRTWNTFTLEYWVDRDAVTLVWGPSHQIVPLGQITRIVRGPADQPLTRPRPWHWPCPERRRIRYENLGVVNAYATRPLGEQVVLVTAGESYSLSPADPEGFVRAVQARFALGGRRIMPVELRRPPIWTWPLWRDRSALFLIAAGLLAVLVMFGALCFRYPNLSSDLPLHFDVDGMPDRIAPKAGLFALPVIGLVVWLFNTATGIWLYRRVQQGAAYLLWGGALVVQGIGGLALFKLMRW
ncbi:MAG: DUF1648 domain-containing protein [Anaerolineae bacterium]